MLIIVLLCRLPVYVVKFRFIYRISANRLYLLLQIETFSLLGRSLAIIRYRYIIRHNDATYVQYHILCIINFRPMVFTPASIRGNTVRTKVDDFFQLEISLTFSVKTVLNTIVTLYKQASFEIAKLKRCHRTRMDPIEKRKLITSTTSGTCRVLEYSIG